MGKKKRRMGNYSQMCDMRQISSNRIAADDSPTRLMALAIRPFGNERILQADIKRLASYLDEA